EEPGLVDILLKLRLRDGQVVRRSAVLLEEATGHEVDPLVLRLRREDRRDEQLERVAELERGSPVGVGLRQPGEDRPGTDPERLWSFPRHGQSLGVNSEPTRARARTGGQNVPSYLQFGGRTPIVKAVAT